MQPSALDMEVPRHVDEPEPELTSDIGAPLRAAAYSVEHLEEHGRSLAGLHRVLARHRDEQRLWKRFEANGNALDDAYASIVKAVGEGDEITPGAEWLLDNFYVVRDQLREIREDLPRRYYRELPKLMDGQLAGYPRVYALVVEIIAHTDSALDEATLVRFLMAYQQSTPLTMGELWAVPIMLRLALVENLRRLADRIVETQLHRRRADSWAEEIIDKKHADPSRMLAERTGDREMPSPLIARMVQRFRDQGHDLSLCWHWLEQKLADKGGAIEEVLRHEHQRQAADQVSTGNAITSMRLISALDWSALFEETSLVERELRQDPEGIYGDMDFATRDRCRHVIEKLARHSHRTEIDVARRTVQTALRAGDDPLRRHIGYYLIDAGRPELESLLGVRPSVRAKILRVIKRHAAVAYLLAIVVIYAIVLAWLAHYASTQGGTLSLAALALALAALPVSEAAVGIVNYLVTLFVPPCVLPRMNFRDGVPANCKTIVVMPTLINNREGLHKLLERLDIHYLANPDPALTFALLTDFADAPQQDMPGDAALLSEALSGIESLNARHAPNGPPKFWLFLRQRQWNPAEGKWMGWERKRGKIDEFNRFLRGATDTSYQIPERLPVELTGIRYVITLDADTQLPLGSARRLISTIAHPLNGARLNPARSLVERGYGILQPRIRINPASANRSRFAHIFSGNPHYDPYVTAVSDVYQDCFGEGSFTGKGIYDLDAFEAATHDAFPENHILSHDLIEGCHARAALVSDVEFIDDFPAQYHTYARRAHRWVRGDWQLLPWLLPRSPTSHGSRANPLSTISHWKILDNMRRSLLPPAILALLVAGWLILPGSVWPWTIVAMFALSMPWVMHVCSFLLGKSATISWFQYLRASSGVLANSAAQVLLLLAFLPHQAWLMVDAIGRTLMRIFVTHKNMLEWETAHATERRMTGTGFRSFLNEMYVAPFIALLLAAAIACLSPAAVAFGALPFLALWFASPAIAYVLSKPAIRVELPLDEDERRELRSIARRTWLFFETFVSADDHWLPPDNFQEYPKSVVAHRTSPTNEGLFLASALAAHDFGYLGFHELVQWLERNLDGWSGVEHYRGHPYNWYDTQTLAPLPPSYISTVDSGNLLSCALTVRQGLLALEKTDLGGPRSFAGLYDAIQLVRTSKLRPSKGDDDHLRSKQLEELLANLSDEEQSPPRDLFTWQQAAHAIFDRAASLTASLDGREASPSGGLDGSTSQVAAITRQVQAMQHDCDMLFPWVKLLSTRCKRPSFPLNNGSISGELPIQAAVPLLSLPAVAALQADAVVWNALEHPWQSVSDDLRSAKSLGDLVNLPQRTEKALAASIEVILLAEGGPERDAALAAIQDLRSQIAAGAAAANELIARIQRLAERLWTLAMQMDFTFLYNRQRNLFSIGYNLAAAQLDRGHYDLLASEARIASFVAIGKGDVDYRHWFHLGRSLTHTAGKNCLLSWGGSMFEFLMPVLLTRNYPETLLEQSCQAAVDRQIEFGQQNGVPWGVSESAFAAVDGSMNYQYQSFGVPGLGLKRGLAEDLVVAPYATALALAVRPHEALRNFRRLEEEGAVGAWGFYDSIDYTPSRLPARTRRLLVRCYFAHHQGMLLVAVANCLLDNRMQRRFHSEPMTRATEMLLQEQIPVGPPIVQPHGDEVSKPAVVREAEQPLSRWLTTPHTVSPRAHLLSNGQYTVAITNAGSGYSSCQGARVTRWRPDTTCDGWGQFIYIRDLQRNRLWSAGHQPVRCEADEYEVLFSVDKAELRRRDDDLETRLEVAVSPDNNVEVRMVTLTNHGKRTRVLDVTSYAELVLTSAEADLAHPAFQKLFVQTEFVADRNALLAWRRPRSSDEPSRFAMHALAIEDGVREPSGDAIQWETDRARFLGRGRTLALPLACEAGVSLSGTTGPVLDPIFSLRRPIQVAAGRSVRLAFSTAYVATREEALALADQFHDLRVVQRAFELAWAQSQVELRHVHLSPGSVHLFQRLASLLLYPDPWKRAPAATLMANRQGQPGLWRYGISGDYPIVLVCVTEAEQTGIVRELLLAHESWRAKDFTVELVLLNEHPSGYADAVEQQLHRLVGESSSWTSLNKRGGVFILNASRMTPEDRTLLQAAAHVVLHGAAGSLERQMEQAPAMARMPAALPIRTQPGAASTATSAQQTNLPAIEKLRCDNGLGCFSEDGKEYVIRLSSTGCTPAPWSNVIANDHFGCLVTEAGCGYTWSENSRENKLTSWSNDPIADSPAEALYLRDDDTGEFWTPTPLPVRDNSNYVIHHGHGYTRFEHHSHGINQRLLITIAMNEPVKLLRLSVRNDSQQPRNLSATFVVEWVLGVSREQTQLHVATEVDPQTGALLATNAFNQEFGGRVSFMQVVGRSHTVTGDRAEFFGRNGGWTEPAALRRVALSGRTGAGFDPCGAVQTKIRLAPGQETEVVFLLGQAANRDDATALLARYAEPQTTTAEVATTKTFWRNVLGALQVRTPNAELDLLLNGWLLYQTLSCRYWGRSALYQSGGAYGFRDQLQDVMALVYSRPDLTREHILRTASRQFEEGDVQHWWHPPSGRGVRTHFSDDLLWLPFVAAHYIATTGDKQILEETIPFLHSPVLAQTEEERYELPETSSTTDTLYGHCLRAIDHGLRFGPHGLPLMGTGDWNDGMNKVGVCGTGESVWVGWFLVTLMEQFAPMCEERRDARRAEFLREQATRLRNTVEQAAWDGAWYRRAYFDDGTPLGSQSNDACQIDSLVQSWSVMAGADAEHSRIAMQAVYDRLVQAEGNLIRLFWPPFDDSELEPGYIKGYVPGIRENGGQYTHAALWVVQATALLGDGNRAMQLLNMLNPLRHANDADKANIYRVEPYVVAADVYSLPPHAGRGGWTWYTGAAGWFYRVGVENILGLQVRNNQLQFHPCIPESWPGYEIVFRYKTSTYQIKVENPANVQHGVALVHLDDEPCPTGGVPLVDDGRSHTVRVVMGQAK